MENTGFKFEFRIFYFIDLQNEEDYRRKFNSEIKIINHGTIPGRTLELYTITKILAEAALNIDRSMLTIKPRKIQNEIVKIATFGTTRFDNLLKTLGTSPPTESLKSIRLAL